MQNVTNYVKNTGLFMLGIIALVAAGGLIGYVFNAVTWAQFSDWLTKAVLVGLVIVLLGAIVGGIAGAIKPTKK